MRTRATTARQVVRVISTLLVIVGLAVLVGLNASDWYAQYLAARNISTFSAQFDDEDDPERLRCLEQAEVYNAKLAGKSPGDTVLPYDEQLTYRGEPMMGYVEIPRIALKLPVYHGTAEAELMSGAGHLEGSSLPIGGMGTHCVLLGHSGMANTRMFDDVRKLGIGDVFVIWTLNDPHAYEVYDVQTVLPDQVRSHIGIEDGEDLATLVTCTPYGINSHRLLVHARRCPYDEGAVASAGSVDTYANARSVPLALAVFMVALSACTGLAGRSLRRRRRAERDFKRALGGACRLASFADGPAHAQVREAKSKNRGFHAGPSRRRTIDWK